MNSIIYTTSLLSKNNKVSDNVFDNIGSVRESKLYEPGVDIVKYQNRAIDGNSEILQLYQSNADLIERAIPANRSSDHRDRLLICTQKWQRNNLGSSISIMAVLDVLKGVRISVLAIVDVDAKQGYCLVRTATPPANP
jgi:hypothetical protein